MLGLEGFQGFITFAEKWVFGVTIHVVQVIPETMVESHIVDLSLVPDIIDQLLPEVLVKVIQGEEIPTHLVEHPLVIDRLGLPFVEEDGFQDLR